VRGADAAQFFLGDPQGWKGPVIPGGDSAAIRDAFAAAGVDIYIHAPYVINVATSNNRIRIPSRKLLDQQLKAAASIGAKGLIVHGGHVTAGVDFADGLENWRKAVERIERPLPMLPRTWASAWTPATPTRPASTSPTRSTGSRRSPAGSTWCTATTRGTSSARAGTGTPTSRPAPSTPRCCSAWSAPPAPRSSARPQMTTAAWPPMSAG